MNEWSVKFLIIIAMCGGIRLKCSYGTVKDLCIACLRERWWQLSRHCKDQVTTGDEHMKASPQLLCDLLTSFAYLLHYLPSKNKHIIFSIAIHSFLASYNHAHMIEPKYVNGEFSDTYHCLFPAMNLFGSLPSSECAVSNPLLIFCVCDIAVDCDKKHQELWLQLIFWYSSLNLIKHCTCP